MGKINHGKCKTPDCQLLDLPELLGHPHLYPTPQRTSSLYDNESDSEICHSSQYHKEDLNCKYSSQFLHSLVTGVGARLSCLSVNQLLIVLSQHLVLSVSDYHYLSLGSIYRGSHCNNIE